MKLNNLAAIGKCAVVIYNAVGREGKKGSWEQELNLKIDWAEKGRNLPVSGFVFYERTFLELLEAPLGLVSEWRIIPNR